MFECACELLVQFIGYMPGFISLYVVFDLLGSFFFNKS